MCTFCDAEQAMLNGERAFDPSLDSVHQEHRERVDSDVERWGYHVTYVEADGPESPPFAYTTGRTRSELPELIVFGLPPVEVARLFRQVDKFDREGRCIEHLLLDVSRATGLLIETLSVPSGWRDTEYWVVLDDYLRRHRLPLAMAQQQIVVADNQGRFPWYRGYRGFPQPLLATPHNRRRAC